MPVYFFDIDDGERLTIDDVGSEMPGPQAARAEAMAVLPAVAKDRVTGDGRTLTATVRDGRGRSLGSAKLTLTAEWTGLHLV